MDLSIQSFCKILEDTIGNYVYSASDEYEGQDMMEHNIDWHIENNKRVILSIEKKFMRIEVDSIKKHSPYMKNSLV